MKKLGSGVVILIALVLLGTGNTSFAQSGAGKNGSVPKELHTTVSIDLNDVTLETALTVIAEKSGIVLNYNMDRIPADRTISLRMRNVPAIQALMNVLNETETGLIVTSNGMLAIIPSIGLHGKITGTVIDRRNAEPLMGVNIVVSGTKFGASTGSDGRFHIPRLSPGVYSLEISMIGYERKRAGELVLEENGEIELTLEIEEKALSLSEVVVTPGYFSLMDLEPVSVKALKAEDVRTFPQLGEDIFRAINRLPGVAGNDFSSKFTVRGGEYDEVLVTLDGMELYDPFHLKDLDGFLGIVDVEAIRNIDMMTGAYSAEYGNCLSGVFNMKTVTPAVGKPRTSMAISFLNARFLSEGTFANGNGQWLFLARRGYLDLMMGWLNSEDKIEPRYYDVLGKFQYTINSKHSISAHLLIGDDNLFAIEANEDIEFDTKYGSKYGWFTWNAQFHPDIFTRTILYKSRLNQDGNIIVPPENNDDISGEAQDKRSFDFFGVRQDWSFDITDSYMVKLGFDVKRLTENHDFYYHEENIDENGFGNIIVNNDTTQAFGNNAGTALGAYFSNRIRLLDPLTAELGLRFDRASWTGDKNVSPRVGLSYNLGNRTVIRAGWGQYYQVQRIDKHLEQDGETRFYPAERSEHHVVGIEHGLKNGIQIRLETYYKKLSSLRPKYVNYQGSMLNPFAELHNDRYRIIPESGTAKGIELFLNRDIGGKWSWWASYSLAVTEQVVDGVTIPRYFDQRHTVYLDVNYRPNRKWCLNVAWNFHTGWPYTDSKTVITRWYPNNYYDFEWVNGPLNVHRTPSYHRMDVRLNRYFETSRGQLSVFFEIRNLYNRKNVREYVFTQMGYWDGCTQVGVAGEEYSLPILPSFGMSWDFR